MSLQDIKQVLSKIISLNKNLDENRLNDLLIASGWEKQNKDDAINVFRTEKKKVMNNLEQTHSSSIESYGETKKEISTKVFDQELAIVEKNELSAEIKKNNMVNFIPANLPIREEDRREIFITHNKPEPVMDSVSAVQEKTADKIIEKSNKLTEINWTPLLAILLIIFLLAFGYMYSHGVL